MQEQCGLCCVRVHGVSGAQVQRNQRDTLWDTWTSTLGFPVMGIWQEYNDGTDINACCRHARAVPLLGFAGRAATALAQTMHCSSVVLRSGGQRSLRSVLRGSRRRSFSNPAFQDTDPLLGNDGPVIVTSSDDGRVRLFNFPSVVQHAPNR